MIAISVLVGAATFGIPNSFGIFFKPIQADLAGSRTAISGVASLYIFLHSAVAVFWGWCTDRYGIRPVVLVGGLLMATGALLTSRIDELGQLYLTYGIVFALGAGAVYVPLMSNASARFEGRRGLALGMVASGAGLGTIIFPPLAERLVSLYGWRAAFAIIGILPLVVIVAGLPFLRTGPRNAGPAPSPRAGQEDTSGLQMSLGQAVRRRAFWVVFGMYVLGFLCLHMVYVHLVPRATDAGVASDAAAVLVSLVGGFSIVGKLAGGALADRIGGRLAFIAVMVLQSLAFVWLILSYQTWMFFPFAIAFGISYGGWMPLIPALAAQLFGARHLGAVFGALSFGAALGGTVGPALAGYAFDTLGSYSAAFAGGAAASSLALALAALGLARLRRAPSSLASSALDGRRDGG